MLILLHKKRRADPAGSTLLFVGLHGMLITILLFVEYLEVRVNLANAHVTSLEVLDQVDYLTGQH